MNPEEMPRTCICGEELNYEGECWQGMIMGGHQGNCVECGKNALLDGMRCCSAECDIAHETRYPGCCDGEAVVYPTKRSASPRMYDRRQLMGKGRVKLCEVVVKSSPEGERGE